MPRTVTQIQFPTPMPKARRVAAYARVSSGKDAMLHSLAAQVPGPPGSEAWHPCRWTLWHMPPPDVLLAWVSETEFALRFLA